MAEFNLEANLFRVYDSKNAMSVQNNNSYDIKSHKWRFYINNYSGTPSAFTLIEANLDEIKIDLEKDVEDKPLQVNSTGWSPNTPYAAANHEIE